MIMRIAGAMLLLATGSAAFAQTSTAPAPGAAGSARPARGPEQSSVPNVAPSASTHQPTAGVNPDPGVQRMNDDAKQQIEREGK